MKNSGSMHYSSVTRRDAIRSVAAATVALGAFGLSSRHAQAAAPSNITVFTWGYGFEAIARQQLVPAYRARHTGSEVTLQIGTNAEMFTQLVAQTGNRVTSGGLFNGVFALRGKQVKLWRPIDRKKIPNAKDIDFSLSPDTGGVTFCAMPYAIAYNPKLTDRPRSIQDLFAPKYKGKVGLSDSMFDLYMLTALMIGKDVNDVPAGIAEWAKHKDQIGPWASSPAQIHAFLDNGELFAAADHGGLAEAARDQGLSVAFAIPKEGATPVVDVIQAIEGFDDNVNQATDDYLVQFLSRDVQSKWPALVGGSPVDRTVTIPDKYLSREGIMTANQLAKLHRYDLAENAAKATEWVDQINRELKS